MTTSDAPEPTPRDTTLLESIDHTRSSILDAVRTGAIAYAAVWVVTFLITGAALLAVAVEDGDVPWSWSLTAPGQAIAMSSHGTFEHSETVDLDEEFEDEFGEEFSDEELEEEFGEDFSDEEFEEGFPDEDIDADQFADSDDEFSDEEFADEGLVVEEFDDGILTTSSRFTVISLSILALMIAALWVTNRRAEHLRPTTSRRAVLAAVVVTGVTFSVLTWLVAFAARVHIGGDSAHAGTLSILFYGSVLGAAVGLLARRPIARRNAVALVPSALVSSARGVVAYLVTFVALLVPAAAIYAIAKGEAEAILMFPLGILNLAVYALSFGQLAGIELPGFPLDDESATSFIWLFSSDVERIMLLLIPMSIVALAIAAAVVARSAAGRPRTSVDAFWLIATFAGTGALLTAISAVTTSTSSFGSPFGGGEFGLSLAPVPWFFLVMAGWGAVTEILIRTLGQPLADLVPDKLLDRLAGS